MVSTQKMNIEEIYTLLEGVKDPEIPVISVIEMGILRSVVIDNDRIEVVITPTFTGCPALDHIRDEVKTILLKNAGYEEVNVAVNFDDPWTSNLITPSGLEKLASFGLAPPNKLSTEMKISMLQHIRCPQCNSENTSLQNMFGPTLCRSIHLCHNCGESFEAFKPI